MTVRPRVLVVDDDRALREALVRVLAHASFDAVAVADGEAALRAMARDAPDAVVLDLVMPGTDGLTVLRRIRGRGDTVPVCVLSARDEVGDRVGGLDAGADDYLVKPFAPEELVARLRAALRRRSDRPGVPLAVGDLRLDPVRRAVERAGTALDLTRREFDLLEVFLRHPGVVLSRTQLLEQVWGYGVAESNAVDVFVGYLRRKTEAAGRPRVLHTVRGVGFVLRA